MSAQAFRLKFELAPGDITVLTPLVRDIALTYGDKYKIEVAVNHPAIFENNPYVSRTSSPATHEIDMRKYNAEGIREANAGLRMHFARFMYEGFERETGIKVPMLKPKADIHMTEYEKWTPPISGRYWLMFAGGKSDVTIKHWGYDRYQKVANELRRHGILCVQTGGVTRNAKTNHIHPPLENVTNIVGWGGIREMLWQIYHAEGIICPITAAMHMASAFDKPVVVIGGGREPAWWEHYSDEYGAFGPNAEPVKVPHRFLHTMGVIDGYTCGFDQQGCWRSKVVRIDDDDRLCTKPVYGSKQVLPACMAHITVDDVVNAVLSYYKDGTLPEPLKDAPEPKLVVKDLPKRYTADALSPQALMNQLPSTLGPMDHHLIGGRFTVCMLLYGPYTPLHKAALEAVVRTLPVDRMDLRVGTNQVPAETKALLEAFPITKVYENVHNRLKYPVMRNMLHDPAAPIDTKYVVWMDDNVLITRPDWADILAQTIITCYFAGDVGIYGDLRSYEVPSDRAKRWFETAYWHKGRPFRNKAGGADPAGSWIHYPAGDFWAVKTDLMRQIDLPDPRLIQKGGDIAIGEQIWQADHLMKSFPLETVGRSMTKRTRGYVEKYPWLL